jgi:hypothetical protein
VVIWDVSLSFLLCGGDVVMRGGGGDDAFGSSSGGGSGDDARGSSGGGGDFVEVVALCGVVKVWFGWVVVEYFGFGFGVGTICGREL